MNDEELRYCARVRSDFVIWAFIRHSSFVIRHSSLTGDISRPDEPSDQLVAGLFCRRVGAHAVGDPDAKAKERRLGGRIWRRGHRKSLWRADDQRVGEVHDMAGRHIFRGDVCHFDP